MLKHLVNDNDRTSLVNALQVAKLQYLADAKTTRGNARIAAQFERQAKDCDRLMALIDDASSIHIVEGRTMALFAVTYEIVTPESAEHGDVDEEGFIAKGISLRDAISAVKETRTNRVDGVEAIECDEMPVRSPRWITVYNGMEYETGAQESRSLHMPETLTSATRCRIARLLGVNMGKD